MSSYPEIAINKYVWHQFEIAKPAIYANYTAIIPFFPVSDIKAGDTAWGEKPYIVYDSMMTSRTRNKYFYPVKSAQMIYSIKGSITEIYEWRDFISNVLDREDIAARDVNKYAGANSLDLNAYFHCINTNQINYIGQTSKISGQIKEYSTDLVIRYDYHINNLYNNG